MKTKYTKKQIQEAINYWEKQLKKMNEASADDILSRWNDQHSAIIHDEPQKKPAEPKRIISYKMGNNTHYIYDQDLIIGMYMQKDKYTADYAIYRLAKKDEPKFKALKGKTQTSTLKSFLTKNAEKIESEEHGRMMLDDFIAEMKRLVGDKMYSRQPVLFTAGLQKMYYHYSANPRHRGKTTMTTQKNGQITYDLDHFKFDSTKFANYDGRTKSEMHTNENDHINEVN